ETLKQLLPADPHYHWQDTFPVPTLRPATKRRRRRWIFVGAGATALVALLALVAIFAFPPSKPPQPPTLATYPLADAAAYQRSWADHLKLPLRFTNDLGMEFMLIPPGIFNMGTPPEQIEKLLSEESNADVRERIASERIRHVSLEHPFYLQTTEVTV